MKESGHEVEDRKNKEQSSNLDVHTTIDDTERGMLLSRSDKHKSAGRSAKEEDVVEVKKEVSTKKLPWWASSTFWILRKCIAPIIMIVMLVVGLYIGYVVVGGQPKGEVFQWSTWKHLWDLVFADS
ncbi:MAG: DNA-directed RNA polymerase subunit beta [Candidatus Pristimantibacillus lignocellulolyticus]|uniref:DNA-directed RNA polymerase subunit beta n=1 Tax=Candidatus Pristimantibacillus lignocellulolyticus TaxID=2994561 RepID=A0A9J6ZIP4_9BACL|nr:MAG: DNA-directed RNA polymerase subunit beta [Candidatus Pristimantibacillus lignocellulolyticus]